MVLTGIAGFIVSLIAAFFMLIGLMPFLGWINWFTTLPFSVLGLVFSSVAITKKRKGVTVAGFVINLAVFIIALYRLYLGAGIF